jgi:hypothetical protein
VTFLLTDVEGSTRLWSAGHEAPCEYLGVCTVGSSSPVTVNPNPLSL